MTGHGDGAKAVATTAVKAATKRLKNTLSKPNTKSKNTQDSDIESNVPRASTTISKKSSSSKPLVMDVDEDSDEPQPAPPKKSSGSKATVIDVDEDSDDDSTSSSGTSPMQEQSDEIELALREVYERDYKGRRVEGEMEVDEPSSPVLSKSKPVKPNRFDELPALQPPQVDKLGDELDRYLSMDIEATKDVLGWWYEKRKNFPTLYRMALDYLTIPATSTDVERVFSRGCFLLPYIRNRLSADSTRALICLGQWSLMGLIHDEDVLAVAKLPEVEDPEQEAEDIEMPDGYDDILGKLRPFLIQNRPYAYSTNAAKISFTLSYLSGTTLEFFELDILNLDPKDPAPWTLDFTIFIKELKDNFRVYDEVGDAEDRLENLHMKDSDRATKYCVSFQQLASQVAWDEHSLQHFFKKGLAPRIKDALSLVSEEERLFCFKAQVLHIDSCYWCRQAKKKRETRTGGKGNSDGKGSGGNDGSGKSLGSLSFQALDPVCRHLSLTQVPWFPHHFWLQSHPLAPRNLPGQTNPYIPICNIYASVHLSDRIQFFSELLFLLFRTSFPSIPNTFRSFISDFISELHY
ncbi:hypothetical protein D9758_003818 [Tetrapyrgos nigripes]|uniref:HAT C-terminal dimerisation domain-containing protein n=1 Tax=Tetrapyrgos nigripes TaxID=182062 RepID=A0A8H5GML6_9AGAR|nr:hypothetical protein D9758_003818 [Tetrapyrgos nigripes]